jgi:hypothetical protein
MMATSQFEKLISAMPFGLDRALLRILSFHNGRDNAIGRGEMVDTLKASGFDVHERQARQVIHDLRRDGHLICSAPGNDGGYYMASSNHEVSEFIDREIHPKAMDLLETEKSIRESAKKKFGEGYQENLFE